MHRSTLLVIALSASLSGGCGHGADPVKADPASGGPATAAPAAAALPPHVVAANAAPAAGAVAAEAHDATGECNCEANCNGKKDDGAAVIGDAIEAVPVDHATARGPLSAPITIVEFADYQCPFCARAEANLRAVEQAHPGDIRFVFQDLPLPFHASARAMAHAALAAGEQGKYWEMHDRLFAHAGAKGADRATIDGIARDLGLDVARFDRDMDDPATEQRVAAEGAVAEALDVRGTPTFFVNGRRVIGAQPAAVLEKAIAKR